MPALTAPVTHQVLDLQKNERSSSATPVPHSGTQKIFPACGRQGFQAVSNSFILTGLMVVSQPLVAHGVGGQVGTTRNRDVGNLDEIGVERLTNQASWFLTNPQAWFPVPAQILI